MGGFPAYPLPHEAGGLARVFSGREGGLAGDPMSPTPKTALLSDPENPPLKGTRPISEKKMATLDELHHLHNHDEEIPGGKKE